MPESGNTIPVQLYERLESHRLWLATDGTKGDRLDLSGLDLVGRSFWRVDLRRALLDGSDLAGANLDHADLRGASLQRARLVGASLWEARIGDADLGGADLRDAKLDHADLRGANLQGADMKGVSLRLALLDRPMGDQAP